MIVSMDAGSESAAAGRRGRKADPVRAEMRKRLSYLSDRNFSTLWVTYRRLLACQKQGGLTAEDIRGCVESTRWRDGRVNVSEFERAGIALLMKAREEHPELFLAESRPHVVKEFRDGVYVKVQDDGGSGDESSTVGTEIGTGRFPGLDREAWKKYLDDVSKGTFDAFWISYRKLAGLERSGAITAAGLNQLVADSYRDDGSMNVSQFRRMVDELLDQRRDSAVIREKEARVTAAVQLQSQVTAEPEPEPEPSAGTGPEVDTEPDVPVALPASGSREEALEKLARMLMDPDARWGEIMELRRRARM